MRHFQGDSLIRHVVGVLQQAQIEGSLMFFRELSICKVWEVQVDWSHTTTTDCVDRSRTYICLLRGPTDHKTRWQTCQSSKLSWRLGPNSPTNLFKDSSLLYSSLPKTYHTYVTLLSWLRVQYNCYKLRLWLLVNIDCTAKIRLIHVE